MEVPVLGGPLNCGRWFRSYVNKSLYDQTEMLKQKLVLISEHNFLVDTVPSYYALF